MVKSGKNKAVRVGRKRDTFRAVAQGRSAGAFNSAVNVYSGAVAAQASVRVNAKGGSSTVTLRKALADLVQLRGTELDAAAIQLENGQSFLLMGVEEDMGGHVHVEQTGRNRVELVFGEDEALEIDPVTEAFLQLKLALFKKGKLNLTGPVSAEDWAASVSDEIRSFEPSS